MEIPNSTFRQVTVNRAQLLEALTNNKKEHDEIYEDALSGYYVRLREELQKRLEALPKVQAEFQAALESVDETTGKPVELSFKHQYQLFNVQVPFPVTHEDDYKLAIKMVELSASDIFSLTQQEFAQYVMNDWSWKEDFVNTNMQYCSGVNTTAILKRMSK